MVCSDSSCGKESSPLCFPNAQASQFVHSFVLTVFSQQAKENDVFE